MISSLFLVFFVTLGFAILCHAPIKILIPTSFIGMLGYTTYLLFLDAYGDVLPVFIAACAIGLLSDICARLMKEPTTIFIIPAIVSLVPGSKLYYTMLAVIEGKLALAAELGTSTLFIAGAIALGLVVEGSLFRIVVTIKRNIFKKGK